MKVFSFIAVLGLLSLSSFNTPPTYKMAKLKYNGGGDWYGDRTALPNLIKFCNENLKTNFQAEDEVVYRRSRSRLAAALAAATAFGARDLVAAHEFLVAGMNRFPVTALPIAESGLGNVLGGNLDIPAFGHIGDGTLRDHTLHRTLDVFLVAADEALPVDGALIAPVQPAVDEIVHILLNAPFTKTSARADTIRTAGVPVSLYIPWPPCAQRSSNAFADLRQTPWR